MNAEYTLRVLLVGEIPERAETLRQALFDAGHEVVGRLPLAADLYRQVCRLQPDVVIIDTESPDRETLERLHLIRRERPRPIVMFSGDADNEKIRAAVSAGVNAYVVDGLSLERIRPIVDAAIARFDESQALRRNLAEVNAKLDERKMVERAKGILMRNRNLSEEEAYHLLRKQAMDKNLRIAQIAEKVISVAEMLD